MKNIFLFSLIFFSLSVFAEDEFRLGQIDVVARRPEMGENNSQVGSVIRQPQIQENNRSNVGDALNLLSGVTMSTNNRNEKTISVRGFDSRQVPLFIDGIPVYVPFDGYVDFNRFTTADLSEIQVSKGFTSMVYGPNTLGGAINLISKRPTRPLEMNFLMGGGTGNEKRAAANLGSNFGKFYVQSGLSGIESDYFPVSGGDHRDNSYRKDAKLSVKAGFTPNKTDEYAVSYYLQNGIKGQPPSTDPTKARYWQWPYWNKQSLYFISQTKLTDLESLKVRLYQDQFDNKIVSYTDDTYSTIKPSGTGSVATGKSIFHDRTDGGSLTLETYRLKNHVATLINHFKSDTHREFDATGTKNTFYQDQLLSFAAEDSITMNPKTTLSLGLAHHILRPKTVYSKTDAYTVPHSQSANEWQSGLFYKPELNAQIYGTIASKTRMPTLKDRYSQRLGLFIPNPDLKAERALNYEVGFNKQFQSNLDLKSALFYSDVTNKIQTVSFVSGSKSQVQNIDKVRIYGTELGLKKSLGEKTDVGGNYTYTYIKNIHDNRTKVTDVPRHKVLANISFRPMPAFKIIPSMEYNSSRFSSNTKEIPGFTIFNFNLAYSLAQNSTLNFGVTNVGDRKYSLSDGFPSPGRMFFANATLEL